MKCKWNQCTNEARAKSPFCSGTCKKRYARSETDVPVEVGQEQVGQPSGTGYEIVADTKCYGRQAVKCWEFGTRPEPLDPTDVAVNKNRGRYIRTDGTVYMFDAIGKAFECTDGEVYPTVDAVRQAAAKRVADYAGVL